jgi:hypothetical protein
MKRMLGIQLTGVFLMLVIGWQLTRQGSSAAQSGNEVQPTRDAFAADRDAGFDVSQAMKHLQEICRIGPRISGSPGMKKQQDLLEKHFASLGTKISWQRFQAHQRSRAEPTPMANMIISWAPEKRRRIMLCSHYDTRPIADQEPDRRKWRETFVSANDGTSSVALLMELGRHISEMTIGAGVDFVFFDGEEYVFEPKSDQYFFGSEYFAEVYRTSRPKSRYVAAVLLDMIAGKDAQYAIEQNSWFHASALVEEIWQVAADQKCKAFQKTLGLDIRDDHLALNNAGIPAVDIIDFSYPHWHRLSDTPENCSADSMVQVARVLSAWLQKAK